MSAKHTPGPWYAGIDRVYGFPAKLTPNIIINPVILGVPVNVTLAKIPRSGDEAEANARLIAAAPDLLAALRDCRAVMRANGLGGVVASQFADAAIAKATWEQQ